MVLIYVCAWPNEFGWVVFFDVEGGSGRLQGLGRIPSDVITASYVRQFIGIGHISILILGKETSFNLRSFPPPLHNRRTFPNVCITFQHTTVVCGMFKTLCSKHSPCNRLWRSTRVLCSFIGLRWDALTNDFG